MYWLVNEPSSPWRFKGQYWCSLINALLRSAGDHHCVSNLSRVLPWYNVVSKCIKCIDIYYVVSTYTDVHNVATKTTISKRWRDKTRLQRWLRTWFSRCQKEWVWWVVVAAAVVLVAEVRRLLHRPLGRGSWCSSHERLHWGAERVHKETVISWASAATVISWRQMARSEREKERTRERRDDRVGLQASQSGRQHVCTFTDI